MLDTETTIDETQALLFGSYRYCRWTDAGALTCEQEGLFYADDLPITHPDAWATLQAYAEGERADVAPGSDPRLRLYSRQAFLNEVLWLAYGARALVVGFNLPFDLSRLAVDVGEARGTFRGGFSLVLWEYKDKVTGAWKENRYRPRLCIKSLDSKRAFIGFSRPRGADLAHYTETEADDESPVKRGRGTFRGHFLDLRTLAFALTSRGFSLASACKAFRVEEGKGQAEGHGQITPAYIDYNRQDVRATAELLAALRREFDLHPVALSPMKAFSPASVAKAYLRGMGLKPPREKFASVPREVLGAAMAAYYGGRAECRIRRTPVPVVYCDFLSMYPTVNTLLGLWSLLTAESLEMVDATDELRVLLGAVTLEECFDQAFWRQLGVFAEVRSEGDILPVRAKYGDTDAYNIGINELTSDTPMWYAAPDLVASKLLTGKAPEIVRAIRLVPRARQAGLQTVALRGAVTVDPRTEDFFRRVIEERARVKANRSLAADEREQLQGFLKVLANSGSYGVYAEMNRDELGPGKATAVRVYGQGEVFETTINAPEDPGAFCFPPIAALIPAAARLMLALLERAVTDAGGTYAFCDTDSMAIVAAERPDTVACEGGSHRTESGEPAVRALSWEEVRAIAERFAQLNPYDRTCVPGSVLKIEDVNFDTGRAQRPLWCYMISAKRYTLYTLGDRDEPVRVRKASEHGLGHLLNPASRDHEARRWIVDVWQHVIQEAQGQPNDPPTWATRPAVSRLSITNPELLRPFSSYNTESEYGRRIKPFNFLLSAHTERLGHPVDANPARFHLVLPYESEASRWLHRRWIERYTGRRYSITTSSAAPDLARVKCYASILLGYSAHPEPKSAAPDGSACGPRTSGLLARRHVRAVTPTHVGKEANSLDLVDAGGAQQWSAVRTEYQPSRNDYWRDVVVPELHKFPRSALAAAARVSERTIRSLRNGHSQPSPPVRRALEAFIVTRRERRQGAVS